MPSSALELSTSRNLGNSWTPGSYFTNVGNLFKSQGMDAITGATLKPSELPSEYQHLVSDPAGDGFVIPPNAAYYAEPSIPQKIEYIDAPYAELYGMDVSTAYQEALANTAYQRKVKDLQAAGLNPVLGYSGSGAASFYGTPAASSYGGASYGSSGSGRTTSEIAEGLSYSLPLLANGIVNLVVTAKTHNSMSGYGAGFVAQNLVSGVLNGIRNFS